MVLEYEQALLLLRFSSQHFHLQKKKTGTFIDALEFLNR